MLSHDSTRSRGEGASVVNVRSTQVQPAAAVERKMQDDNASARVRFPGAIPPLEWLETMTTIAIAGTSVDVRVDGLEQSCSAG